MAEETGWERESGFLGTAPQLTFRGLTGICYMVRTNPDVARLRAENNHFNRENTLAIRSASISRVTQKKFSFTGGRKQGERGLPWQSIFTHLPSDAGELGSHMPRGE